MKLFQDHSDTRWRSRLHIVESLCPGEHRSPGSPLQAGLTQRLSSDPLFFSVSLYVLSVPVPRLTFAHGPAMPLHSRCCRNHLMEDDCRAGPGGVAVHRGNGIQEAREGQSRGRGAISLHSFPSQALQEALQCCSGSLSGTGTEARLALLPPAPSFLPSPRWANICEP